MSCLRATATASLLTGFVHVSRLSGEPETLPPAALVPAGLAADAITADGSENAPLTRWPGTFALESATLSSASPAVETTFAVVVAVYVLPTPGVNAPKAGAVPSDSESCGGTGAAGGGLWALPESEQPPLAS